MGSKRLRVQSLLFLVIIALCCGCRKTSSPTQLIELASAKNSLFVQELDSPATVLLLGSDSRSENTAGLSDVIIVAKIDPGTGRSILVSIPRDSRVTIPGHGTDKLNAAMVYGGPQLTAKTVEELLGIEIDYYAVTTFYGFSRMVNSLGGVEVELSQAVNDPWAGANLPAGKQRLNGQSALALARSRHNPDGDFARMKHQQDILLSIWREHKKDNGKLEVLFSIASRIDGNIATIVKPTKLLVLARAALKMNPDDCKNFVLRGPLQNINAVSYVIIDNDLLKQAKRALAEL